MVTLTQSKEHLWIWGLYRHLKNTRRRFLNSSFPSGSVVKNQPARIGRRHGFDPWSGRIPHAPEQLTP